MDLILANVDKNTPEFEQSLCDEFASFMSAGSETTALFITFLLFEIFRYPQVEKRLREEIEEYIKCDDDINLENLKKLTYM